MPSVQGGLEGVVDNICLFNSKEFGGLFTKMNHYYNEPPPSGNARGIVLPHLHGHRNGQQRGGGMLLIFVLIVFLAAAGAIRSK
jgi:hypothetical protein